MKILIKNPLVPLFFFIISFSSTGQNQLINKYWHYRYRLINNFVSVGGGQGQSIPAGVRNLYNGDVLSWGEGVVYLGYYIGVLSTEYSLLKSNNQPLNETIKELYYALLAVYRLNAKGEAVYFKTPTAFPGSGFMIRDDVRNIEGLFGSGPNITSGNGTVGACSTATSDFTDPNNQFLGQIPSSQDLYYAVLMGLELTYHLTDDNLSFDNKSGINIKTMSYQLAQKILNYMIFTSQFELVDPGANFIGAPNGGDCEVYETPLVQLGNMFGLNTSNVCDLSNSYCENLVWQNAQTRPYAINFMDGGNNLKMTMELAAMTNAYGTNTTEYFLQNCAGDEYNSADWDLFYTAILGVLYPDQYNSANFSFDNCRALTSLNAAPSDGPFCHSSGDIASNSNWASPRRFYDAWPAQSSGHTAPNDDFEGNYNGLDFMLFFNLYYLINQTVLNPPAQIPYTNINNPYSMEYPIPSNQGLGTISNPFTIINPCSQIVVDQLHVHGFNGDDGALIIEGGPAGVDFKPQATPYTTLPSYFPIEDWVETDNHIYGNGGGYLHVICNLTCDEDCLPNSDTYVYLADPGSDYDHKPSKSNKNDSNNDNLPPYKMTTEFDSPNQNLIIAYPNPFQSQTTIEFKVKETSIVTIYINDVQGEKIAVLFDGMKYSTGSHTVIYNGASLAAGTYYCILQTSNDRKITKLVKTK